MPRSWTILGPLLLGAACGGGGTSTPVGPSSSTQTTAVHRDLVYSSTPRRMMLDLHLPSTPAAAPVIVYLHGSAGGKSADTCLDVALRQRGRGFAVASIDFSGPDQGFPAMLQDAKAAVRWLRANAATYNLDPNRMAAWGYSAGGYVAGLLGTTDGVAALEDPRQGAASQSSRVQAVVAFAGFFDLTEVGSPEWLVSLLGCDPVNCPGRVAEATTITYVDGGDSPFLLVHGRGDTTVPFRQSQLMHAALTAAGAPSTLVVVDGLNHLDGWGSSAVTQPTEAFLDRYLR